MAERRLAERPAMQRVNLDEDAMDAPPPVRSAPERLHEVASGTRVWAARRPAAAVAATVAVVTLVAVAVLAGPRWLDARDRAEVLGAAAFDGAVHSLRQAPQVRWSARIDGAVAPVLVGDVLVGAAGSVDGGDRRLVGLDAVTGEARWTVPLGADPVPDTVMCRATGDVLACVSGPVSTSDRNDVASDPPVPVGVGTLWAIDPADGTVLASHPIDGWLVATTTLGPDLVVATYASGLLSVHRINPVTDDRVWETPRFVSARTPQNGRIRLVAGGGLVMASGNDSTLLLDASTGVRVERSTDALGADESRLLPDGTLVRSRYRLLDSAIVSRTSLSDGLGEPWLTAEGSALSDDASDGSSGLVLTSDGLGVDGISAYRRGVDEEVWHSSTKATRVSVDAAGAIVVRNGGTLAGLDATDGSVSWAHNLGAISGTAATDGQRVVVLSGGVDDHPVLTALDLHDGRTVWELPLPQGTRRVIQLGTQLYAVGDDGLAALRP